MFTEYFDCLRCSAVTRITACPPKCAVCGSGTGVIAKSPEGAVRKREEVTPRAPAVGRGDAKTLLQALQQQQLIARDGGMQPPDGPEKRV